jgi:hypothetical protein
MATFKYSQNFHQSPSGAFDRVLNPGSSTPHSGIYRCEGCGHEVASNAGDPLPPQDHHQHTAAHGSVRWRLLARTG